MLYLPYPPLLLGAGEGRRQSYVSEGHRGKMPTLGVSVEVSDYYVSHLRGLNTLWEADRLSRALFEKYRGLNYAG